MTASENTTLGPRIRTARHTAGFKSPERFAVKLGVSVATLQRWETGKTEPSLAKLREIATATGETLTYFLHNGGKQAA